MDFERAKYNMVEQQIRPWNVLDPVILETMMTVPREDFVPNEYRSLAFADMNIPIGDNQVMMQPKVEARMLQALAPQDAELALEIGAGTGFVAALMARHAQHVHTIDLREAFVELAHENLRRNRIGNVEVWTADGSKGWNDGYEYDRIFVSGALVEDANDYRDMLKIGGRLVAIVGQDPVMSAIQVDRLSSDSWNTTYLFETYLPHLDNIKMPNRFVF